MDNSRQNGDAGKEACIIIPVSALSEFLKAQTEQTRMVVESLDRNVSLFIRFMERAKGL